MRILIAEDERITRMSLKRQLEGWGHTIVATEDGQQAWEQFRGAEFDMVLTDWEMPRVSGVELIQRIREAAPAGYVYVIMLTSRSDKSDVVKGIEAGADDFVCKPFDRDELRVRLLAGERIVNLERTLSRQNVELREANERIRHGLEAAARVQQAMLPGRSIVTPRSRTAWTYVPTEELAGDAIGLHLIEDRYLVIYVLDVSGHGVPAALLSVMAMHAMEPVPEAASLLRDLGGESGIGTVQRPGRVAVELNRRFSANGTDGRYFTMVLCVLDTLEGRLYLTCAGHPSPFVLRGSEAIMLGAAGGLPIGILDCSEYDDESFQLERGDRIHFFSDGVLEQREPTRSEQFGGARLVALLSQNREKVPEEAVGAVVEALSKWAGTSSFEDDVSLVIIDWLGEGLGGENRPR